MTRNDDTAVLFATGRLGCVPRQFCFEWKDGDAFHVDQAITMARKAQRLPVHPGEILRDLFMADFELSIHRLARDLRVPPTSMSQIVNLRRSISPDTALRLGRYFRTTPEFWLNLQLNYDLDAARTHLRQLEADSRPITAA